MVLLPIIALLAVGEFDQTHKLWTDVLSAHVRGGGFDYKKLAEDRSKLDAYLGSLETVMPEEFAGWKREQQFAFWIDAYNAYAVRRVVDAYPIESIQDLGDDKASVWDQDFIPLGRLFPEAGDRRLTLNDVENRILRPKFKDARVHVAIHRASRGGPPILAEALVAERLDKQLDASVARWLSDPERNRFERKPGRIVVSKVFDWSRDDFTRDAGSVQAWIAARAPESERAWLSSAEDLKIEYMAYSWKLDEAR